MGSVFAFIISMCFFVRSIGNYFLLIDNHFHVVDNGELSWMHCCNACLGIVSLFWMILFGLMIMGHIAVLWEGKICKLKRF